MRLFPVVLFLTAAIPAISFAAEFETGSDIRAVTVYTSRAKLTRQAAVEIPAGAHTVIFKDLPAGILTDSLRIEGKAAAQVTFGALAHKQEAKAELAAPREKELRAQMDALQDQRRIIETEKAALAAQKTFIENIGTQAMLRNEEEIAEINLRPEQWAAAAEAIRAGLADVYAKDVAQNIKLRELDKEIQKVQMEINQLYTGQHMTWQVSVPVEADAATKLTLDLSYQVDNATWAPLYDARLDTDKGALELVQYGAVRQQTGEDWSNAALTLSTAQPHRGAGLPELQPLWVDMWQGGVAGGGMNFRGAVMKSEMAVAESTMMAMDAAAPPPMAAAEFAKERDAGFQQAQIETGGFVSEYKIPGPGNVPADGTETKLMVGSFETENQLQIQVKPQMSTEAYLVARSKLKGEAPVLPGQVSLFRDGAYVGQSFLPLLRPGEEQDLSFGIDDQVSAERRVMKDERSEDGVIARDNAIERHFVTELQNLHAKPVDIVVLETIPVAQNEEIKVDIIKNATTQGFVADKDNIKGLLEWKMKLAPKEEKAVNLGWKVSWPKDHQLSGI